MANSWVNNADVLQIAELALADEAVIPYASNRSFESKFVGGTGTSVDVSVPRAGTGKEFTSTTSAGSITATRVPVKIEKHFYERFDVTSEEDLVDLRSFSQNILLPGIQAVVTSAEQYLVRKASAGYSPSVTGSAGTEITTKAQYYAAEKAIFDAKGNTSNLVALLTSTSYSNVAQLTENNSIDYNPNGPANLAGNMIGQIANVKRTFRSRHAGSATQTAWTGTPVTNGAGSAGERVLMTIDGLTLDAGTRYYAGQRFTVADSTGTFILLEDLAIGDSGEITGYFYAPDAWTDGKAITAGTAIKQNIIYNPASLACVILPGMPGSNAMTIRATDALGNDCGFAIRMIETEISGSTLGKSFVFDAFVGASVVERLHGVVCN